MCSCTIWCKQRCVRKWLLSKLKRILLIAIIRVHHCDLGENANSILLRQQWYLIGSSQNPKSDGAVIGYGSGFRPFCIWTERRRVRLIRGFQNADQQSPIQGFLLSTYALQSNVWTHPLICFFFIFKAMSIEGIKLWKEFSLFLKIAVLRFNDSFVHSLSLFSISFKMLSPSTVLWRENHLRSHQSKGLSWGI